MGLILLFCGYTIWRGRPELALGLYLSAWLWTRLILFAGVSQTWVFLAAVALSTLVYMHRERSIVLIPTSKRFGNFGWVPESHRWIIGWMLLSWFWSFALLYLFDARSKIQIYRPMLLIIIAVIPVIMLFASDLKRVKGFAASFIFWSAWGGYMALRVLDIPLSYLLSDPGLSDIGILRLGLVNYHFFSHFCALALLLCIPFLSRPKVHGWPGFRCWRHHGAATSSCLPAPASR